MKIVSILGIERGDYSYYLSLLLKALKGAVLVIDNSLTGNLFDCVTRNNQQAIQDRCLEYQNIAFVRGVEYAEETFEKFDYVVNFNGFNHCDEIVAKSDHIFVMPDYHLDTLQKTKEIFDELQDQIDEPEGYKAFIIMRDLINEKITDLSVASYIGVDAERIVGHIGMDGADFAKQLSFEYNGKQSVKGLSTDFCDALSFVLLQVTGKDPKLIKKLFKKS